MLLEQGAYVNSHGGFYTTALEAAEENGHEGTVQLLLEAGADTDEELGYPPWYDMEEIE